MRRFLSLASLSLLAALTACDPGGCGPTGSCAIPSIGGRSTGGTGGAGGGSTNTGGISHSSFGLAVIEIVNAERVKTGLRPVRANGLLAKASRLTAQQMASLGTMTHSMPGAPYPEPADRVKASGYQANGWGENLLMSGASITAQEAMAAWMASPGHRENILRPEWIEVGIAEVTTAAGLIYVAQTFGIPR